MIKSIRLKNFQSHKETNLTFGPGVNIITGTSDSGKTAIFRALRWVCWNRPSGDAFRSHWGGDTKVELLLDNCHQPITRVKTKTDNYYQVGDAVYKAMGTEVPEEVQKLLNINHINLQMQLDRPFLLDLPPGQVAKHFNAIAHLDVIDRAVQNVERWVRETQQEIKHRTQQGERWKEELETYSYLPELEAKLEAVEAVEYHRNEIVQKVDTLENVIQRGKALNEKIASKEKILLIEPKVISLIDLMARRDQLTEDEGRLNLIVNRIKQNESDTNTLGKKISLDNRVTVTLTNIEAKNDRQAEWGKSAKLIRDIHVIEKSIRKERGTLALKEKKFRKAMGKRCPLCGQEIKDVA